MRKIVFLMFFFVVLFPGMPHASDPVSNCINYYQAGDYRRAIDEGKRAIRLYPKSFSAHVWLGASYVKIGEFDLALSTMRKAERLAKSKENLSSVYNNLGLIYDRKGDLDNALLYYTRYFQLNRELGDRGGEAIALSCIAGIYMKKGDLDKALQYYNESLRLQTDEKENATTYNNIAIVYSQKGDYQRAVEYLEKAIDIGERHGDYHRVAQRMLNLGDTYRQMKKYREAFENLTEGLKRIQKVGDKYWEALAYEYFGCLYRDQGDVKSAEDYLRKAYNLLTSIGVASRASGVASELSSLRSRDK